MRTAVLLVAAALAPFVTLAGAGCNQARTSFACTDNASCRDGAATGTCQPNGACSFPDATCTSGQRYGTASGAGIGGVCVGDEPLGDGGVTPPATDMLMAFTTTDKIPIASYTHASAVLGNQIFVSGGILGSTARDQVFVGTVNLNAIEPVMTLQGGWAATTPLPVARRNHGMAAVNDHLYVMGGRTTGTNATPDVLSAPVSASGVGAWTPSTAMPFAVRCAPAVATSTHLFVVGGKDSSSAATDRVLSATAANGTVGTWGLAGRLPVALSCPAAVVHNDYLFVVGGCAASGQGDCGNISSAVYAAQIMPNGTLGTFATLTAMPAGRWHHTAAVGNGFLYVLGGGTVAESSTQTELVWAAPINTDHTLGTWGTSRPLPIKRQRASAQVVGDYLFVIHGETQVARLKSP